MTTPMSPKNETWAAFGSFRLFFLAQGESSPSAAFVRDWFASLTQHWSGGGIEYRFDHEGTLQWRSQPPGSDVGRVMWTPAGFYALLVNQLTTVFGTSPPLTPSGGDSFLLLQHWLEQQWWEGRIAVAANRWSDQQQAEQLARPFHRLVLPYGRAVKIRIGSNTLRVRCRALGCNQRLELSGLSEDEIKSALSFQFVTDGVCIRPLSSTEPTPLTSIADSRHALVEWA